MGARRGRRARVLWFIMLTVTALTVGALAVVWPPTAYQLASIVLIGSVVNVLVAAISEVVV